MNTQQKHKATETATAPPLPRVSKTLVKLAKGKRYGLPILKTLAVHNGRITSTDLDIYISDDAPQGLADGCYYAEGFAELGAKDSSMPLADFPDGPKLGDELGHINVPAGFILDQLAWVAKAMSTEQVRYYLNGICFADNGAGIVATDGHRLHRAMFAAPWPVNSTYNMGMILPAVAVKALIALVKESTTPACIRNGASVRVTFYKYGFAFDIGTARLVSKVVDGTFPEWRRVIPASSQGQTAFNPLELVKPLKEAKIIARMPDSNVRRSWAVVISCHKKLHLRDADKDWPFSSVVPAKACPDGIGFNLRYLADVCAGTMHYTDAMSPIRIEGIAREAVLMPLRV